MALKCSNSDFFVAFSLDYPGVGPEHSFLKDTGRAEYYSITDEEALEGIGLWLRFVLYSFDLFFFA